MATASEHGPIATPEPRGRRLRLLVADTWPSLAIAVIWLVLLFDALFGPDIVVSNPSGFSRIPSAVVVAFFAYLATLAVAKYGFGPDARSPYEHLVVLRRRAGVGHEPARLEAAQRRRVVAVDDGEQSRCARHTVPRARRARSRARIPGAACPDARAARPIARRHRRSPPAPTGKPRRGDPRHRDRPASRRSAPRCTRAGPRRAGTPRARCSTAGAAARRRPSWRVRGRLGATSGKRRPSLRASPIRSTAPSGSTLSPTAGNPQQEPQLPADNEPWPVRPLEAWTSSSPAGASQGSRRCSPSAPWRATTRASPSSPRTPTSRTGRSRSLSRSASATPIASRSSASPRTPTPSWSSTPWSASTTTPARFICATADRGRSRR